MNIETQRDEAHWAMRQAKRAARLGHDREAERWLKIAERTAAAAERIAALPEPEDSEEKVEELRAEFRARIARYVAANNLNVDWEMRREVRKHIAAYAQQYNLPEPPEVEPEPPFTDEQLELTGAGAYHPLPHAPPALFENVRRELMRRIEQNTPRAADA